MKSATYEYRKKSARRGAQFVPIGMPTVCWKTRPPNITNMLSIKNSVSENFLVESVFFFFKKKKDMSFPSTMYLYLRWPFFNNVISFIQILATINTFWKHLFIFHLVYNFLPSLKMYAFEVFYFLLFFQYIHCQIFYVRTLIYFISVQIYNMLCRWKTLQLLSKNLM